MKQMKLRLPVIVTCVEEGYYFAEVPIIRGSTEGDTKEDVLAKMQDVVRLCMSHAAEECDTLPTKYTIEQVDVTITHGVTTPSRPIDNRLADRSDCWYNEHC